MVSEYPLVIAPSWRLCKKIPTEAFPITTFYWVHRWEVNSDFTSVFKSSKWELRHDSEVFYIEDEMEAFELNSEGSIPIYRRMAAPMLKEILIKLMGEGISIGFEYEYRSGKGDTYYAFNRRNWARDIDCCVGPTMEDAALKLWLQIYKKEKNEEKH